MNTYIVPVRTSHFKATVPLWASMSIAVANDILEGIAATPLAVSPPRIPLHRVPLIEVVPGPDELN